MDSNEIVNKLQGRSIFPWHPRPGQEYVMWDYEKDKYIIFTYTLQPSEFDGTYQYDGAYESYEWIPIGYGLLP